MLPDEPGSVNSGQSQGQENAERQPAKAAVRTVGVIFMGDGGSEQREYAIAQRFGDVAFVVVDGFHHQRVGDELGRPVVQQTVVAVAGQLGQHLAGGHETRH